MKYTKSTTLLVWVFFLITIRILLADNFTLTLSTEKNIYYQEEEIFLLLDIKNISEKTSSVNIEYLQPIENQSIFMGNDFKLLLKSEEGILDSFTNFMPPEPKPGSKDIKIEPGEKTSWKIFFPYYYYPLKTPNIFNIQVSYKGVLSNKINIEIKKTRGKRGDGLLINPDFSQGEEIPYGWKLLEKRNFWDKQEDRLVFTLDKEIAESEGVWAYSLLQEIDTPGEFSLDARLKSSAPKVILFVEGWGIVKNRWRRLERNELFVHPPDKEMKNYRFKVLFKNPKVKLFRVKLYSYLKVGQVWFDYIDIVPTK